MYFRSNTYKTAAIVVIILAGILGGLICLTSPEPKDLRSIDEFSAINASSWIKEISKKPHSVFDTDEHQRILGYLADELEKLGLEVSLMHFTARNTEPENGAPERIEIQNIHARLEGKSENSILLVAHYDSVYGWDFERDIPKGGESYGAADDGYGVAVILETVRAIRASGRPLENDIQILLSDAEELGMVGTEKEMAENPDAFKNVKLVMNVEARGIKGPVIMFETSDDNEAIMEFYIKNARRPLSYSFATDIYRLMPNETDFTRFIQQGFNGYNFSVLYNLDYYHTAYDNFENISLSSIQHYGEQVLPVIKAFALTPYDILPSFKSNRNSVFFTISPSTIVSYSKPAAIAMLVIAMALYLFVMTAQKRNGNIDIKKVFGISALYAGELIVLGMLGTLVALIMSRIFNAFYSMIYLVDVPMADIQQLLLIALGAAAVIITVIKTKDKKACNYESILAGMTINMLYSAVSTIFLTGASFLFVIPSLLTAFYCLSVTLTKSGLLNTLMAAFAIIITLVIYIPIVYLVYLALTFGAAGIVAVVSGVGLITIIPVTIHYTKR